MQPRPVLGAIAAGACFFGFWLLCAMNDSPAECLAAGVGAALATAGLMHYARAAGHRFRPDGATWAQVRHIPGSVLGGSVAVLAELGRRLFKGRAVGSHLTAWPFQAVEGTPRDAARRACAEFLPSISPNFVTLGAIPGQKRLLFHQTRPTGVTPIVRTLGGKSPE